MKTLPRDPEHSIWTEPTEFSVPPLEAYRYFPTGNCQRVGMNRFVYRGNTPFLQDEEEKYEAFEKFLEASKDRLTEIPEG